MHKEQYAIICARRQASDQLVWQVPSLATAAQAFLISSGFDPDVAPATAFALSMFSAIVGFASIQLMAKSRYLEFCDAELLSEFERDHAEEGYALLHGDRPSVKGVKRGILARLKSFYLWILVLAGFCFLAVYRAVDLGADLLPAALKSLPLGG